MTHIDTWQTPPEQIVFADNEVHVWRAFLDLAPAHLARLCSTLANDETQRVDRFSFEHLRNHAIVSRGVLRIILGRYLQTQPQDIRFSYNAYGKPELASAYNHHQLRFNVAHSAGIVLYALTRTHALGVDIEYMRSDLDLDQLVPVVLSPVEQQSFRALPQNMRQTAFFNCMVRKEAYVKALGGGLSIPLDSFAVTFVPGEQARLVYAESQDISAWTFSALTPGPHYAAAFAVRNQHCRLKCWQWNTQL